MSKLHILIVEDEIEIAGILKDYLLNEGFLASIIDNGNDVVPFVKKEIPSLILLDIMLPYKDGKTICKEIRKFSDIPIIMLTAKVEEIDRIIGLEIGADDYICKPFSPREVIARINAVLRRINPKKDENKLLLGPVELNKNSREVFINGQEISLTPSEFDILCIMLENPNRIYSRSQLIEMVQGYNFEGYDRTIDFHIKNLRKKIALYIPNQPFIQSAYGQGYKLIINESNG